MEENNNNRYNSLFSFFCSILYLISGAIEFLNNKIDKVGVNILYFRLGLVIVLWIFCAIILALFFSKKIWRSNQKIIPITMLICVIGLSVIRVSYFTDAFSDFQNGAKTITTNEYPVVWDRIYFSSSSDEYAYVSEDIAKTLNDNKVLTVTSNLGIEREDYVGIVYYPKTHILISAEIIKHTEININLSSS